MRATLANLNHCAVPFLSRDTVNLCWYHYTYMNTALHGHFTTGLIHTSTVYKQIFRLSMILTAIHRLQDQGNKRRGFCSQHVLMMTKVYLLKFFQQAMSFIALILKSVTGRKVAPELGGRPSVGLTDGRSRVYNIGKNLIHFPLVD